MIDIDNFKNVNDTYGHLTGDLIIKQIGSVLQQNIRKNDCAFRWGGDEFAIVLPATGRESAIDIAERLRIYIENYNFNAEPAFLKLTISIGLVCTNKGIDRDSMVDSADQALYEAKINRNTVAVY